MKNLGLLLTLLTLLATHHTQARSPAVEDFVGIPPEQAYQGQTDKKINDLYNFGQQIQNKTASPTVRSEQFQVGYRFSYLVVLFGLLSLPFALWYGVMNVLDKKEQEGHLANVEVLSKYKNQKNNYGDGHDDDIKKAS